MPARRKNKGRKEAMKDQTIIITAKRGYTTEGLRKVGYTVLYPYRDRTFFGRCLREVWFRLGLPESAWYSREVTKLEPKYITLHDPQITREYLLWLQKEFPKAKLHFQYDNMVGNARHLFPDQIPEGIDASTYDAGDSEKYGLRLRDTGGGFFPSYIGTKRPTKYDVFFVGADKGRGEYLMELQKQMQELGLKTKFIITADGRFAKRKPYYSRRISYEKVIEYDNESRAILNVTMPGQVGATMRDYESVYNQVKLITTNPHIKNFDIYKEENVFILGERDLAELPAFLSTPFVPLDEEILKRNLMS